MSEFDDNLPRRGSLDRLLEKLIHGPVYPREAHINPLDVLELIGAGLVKCNEDQGTISLTDEGRRRICSAVQADERPHHLFKPGDPVRLKSGGPLMTVLSIELSGAVACMWSNPASGSYENEYDSFPPDALEYDA